MEKFDEMHQNLQPMIEEIWNWSLKNQVFGRTLTLKMKFNDFQISSKSKTFSHPIKEKNSIEKTVTELLQDAYTPYRPVRLLGISLSNLDNNKLFGEQLEIKFP